MFMSFILFIFFLITPKGNKIENRILAALVLVFGFQIFIALSLGNYGHQYFLRQHLYIYALKLTCFTSGPLIYYYIRAFLNKNKSIRFRFIHFVPFLCSLGFFGYFKFDINVIGRTSVFIVSLSLVQNIVYIISSVFYFKKCDAPLKSLLSDFRDFSLMNWIHIVLLGYIAIWIVQLNSLSIYVILRQPDWCAYTSSICNLIILIFALLILFLLLLRPEIYYAIRHKNYSIDSLSKDEYLNVINDYFKFKKPYLNPEISLEKVATDISIHPRLLSQLINEFCKMNFKGFINDFRIRECVSLFSEDIHNERTIQEIYYMAGFNSRSVFNELFKKHTGLTPKEYKEKQNRQNRINIVFGNTFPNI